MKLIACALLSLFLVGCSMFGAKSQRPAETVLSCFSDGENQSTYCKTVRTQDNGKTVVTRCIGAQNPEVMPSLRGKCVEKICSDAANMECQTRGEFAVLEKFADLASARLFADEAASQAKKEKIAKVKEARAKAKVEAKAEIAASTVAAMTPTEEPMQLTLRPVGKPHVKPTSRVTASVKANDGGLFKKVCVNKEDAGAPEIFRGKCATRTCTNSGKCTYQGRKEIFEWISRN
jgi:hypothetical protein